MMAFFRVAYSEHGQLAGHFGAGGAAAGRPRRRRHSRGPPGCCTSSHQVRVQPSIFKIAYAPHHSTIGRLLCAGCDAPINARKCELTFGMLATHLSSARDSTLALKKRTAYRWRFPGLGARSRAAAAPAGATPPASAAAETGGEGSGVVWQRGQQQQAADADGAPLLEGGGLAEAGFPEARSLFPVMPSPWDDPEFYALGLHVDRPPPPPPPPLPLPAHAAANGAAAAAAATGGGADAGCCGSGRILQNWWGSRQMAACSGGVTIAPQRQPPPQQDAAAAGAGVVAAAPNGGGSSSSSSSKGVGGQLIGTSVNGSSGGSLKLPPRLARAPIIPPRRVRSIQGGAAVSGAPQDDPAVLDNLEDEATPQRRPLAAASSSGRIGAR